MMNEERKQFVERLEQASERIFTRAESRLIENKPMPAEVLSEIADIVKDVSAIHKNISKTIYFMEHAHHAADSENL